MVTKVKRALDEARAQEVVDAEGAGGHCPRGIGAGAGEERPDLVVVQDPSVPVVGNPYLVCAFDVRRSKVAADPGGQATPRVSTDRQHRPVEGLQGLIDPVEELAPIRGEEGVGDAHLEDREFGPGLQVERLPDVKLER